MGLKSKSGIIYLSDGKMDYLLQYYRLLEIKPEFHRLSPPYLRPSQQRFRMNVEELDLWYNGSAFVTERPEKTETGGSASKQDQEPNKIKVLEL